MDPYLEKVRVYANRNNVDYPHHFGVYLLQLHNEIISNYEERIETLEKAVERLTNRKEV